MSYSQNNIAEDNTSVPANAYFSLAAASSQPVQTTNNGRVIHNLDLNLASEETPIQAQGVQMDATPQTYHSVDPHLIGSRMSPFSTLSFGNGVLLRRNRSSEEDAFLFQRNTRFRTDENGGQARAEAAASALPTIGRNLYGNSQFEIGSTAPETRYPAGSLQSSVFHNQSQLQYPQPVLVYRPQPLQLSHEASLNSDRVLGFMQHLNSIRESNPPPHLMFANIAAKMQMPAGAINPDKPWGDAVAPPLFQQLGIGGQGPANGLPPQEVDFGSFALYRNNGVESEAEGEGSEDEQDLDDEDYVWDEEPVDMVGFMENEEGDLVPLDYDEPLTENIIMENLPISNYVPRTVPSSDEDEACIICLDNFIEGDNLAKLGCCHRFHFRCMKEWLLKKNECPLCKITVLDV